MARNIANSSRNGKKRSGKGLPLDPCVERLVRAADRQGVAPEMSAILGFLLEKNFLTSNTNGHLEQYKHLTGFSFTCLRVFKDWCCVTPKKRQAWCQGRNFSNEVLESVCNFITMVMNKLHPDTTSERTTFRKDSKAAEKCVLQLFLDGFSDSLSVYSGSPHIGYVRLSDKQKIRPADVKKYVNPSKYALLFTLARGFRGKEKTLPQSKCALYPTDDIVEEHIRMNENKNLISTAIDLFFNKVHFFKINDLCPGVLRKVFSTQEGTSAFVENVKTRTGSKNCDLFFDVDFAKKSLTIHASDPKGKENIILDNVKTLLAEEKEKIIGEQVSFAYPQPGSGVSVHVSNYGQVNDVVSSDESHTDDDFKRTLLIYVQGIAPNELAIKKTFQRFGLVVKTMSDEKTRTPTRKPRLWGKLHCDSEKQKQELPHDVSRKFFGSVYAEHVKLRCIRPDVRPASKGVEFIRLSMKSIAMPVNKVTIHRVDNSWVHARKYVVIGKEPCKLWWCNNGDGVFSVNNQFVTNQTIAKAIRKAFGSSIGHYKLTIDRNAEFRRRFPRETEIEDKLIKAVSDVTVHYDITQNKTSNDEIHNMDFVDIFENGKEFLHDYKMAKEHRRLPKNLWIHGVEFYSVVMVKPEVYKCVKTGLDVVSQTVDKNRLGVTIDVSSEKDDSVLLEIHGKDETEVERVSNVVKKVISKETIGPEDEVPENRGYLLPYLASCGGKGLLQKLECALDVKCFFHPPWNQLCIYGPPECKKEAKDTILNLVRKLPQSEDINPPNEEFKIPILKYLMKLYGKEFNELCRQSGVTSLYWNSKLGHFTVWGKSACVEVCKRKITEASEFVSSSMKSVTDRYSCVACLSPVQGVPFHLSMCGHAYCESCISEHVKIAIKDKSLPIPCAAADCKEFVLLDEIGRSCNYSKEGLRQLLDAAVAQFIAQMGRTCTVGHCIAPDCPGLYFISLDKYSGQEIHCGTCGVSICNCCQVSPYHKSYTCTLWKHKTRLDEDTARWFSDDVDNRRMCPRCGVGIEKYEGCSNVYCINCKASICFKCMAHYDDSSYCYDHMQREHGGPY